MEPVAIVAIALAAGVGTFGATVYYFAMLAPLGKQLRQLQTELRILRTDVRQAQTAEVMDLQARLLEAQTASAPPSYADPSAWEGRGPTPQPPSAGVPQVPAGWPHAYRSRPPADPEGAPTDRFAAARTIQDDDDCDTEHGDFEETAIMRGNSAPSADPVPDYQPHGRTWLPE